MTKYRAKVTIEFDVRVHGKADDFTEVEVETAIQDLTSDSVESLYDNIGAGISRIDVPYVDVELKPVKPVKRASKRRR